MRTVNQLSWCVFPDRQRLVLARARCQRKLGGVFALHLVRRHKGPRDLFELKSKLLRQTALLTRCAQGESKYDNYVPKLPAPEQTASSLEECPVPIAWCASGQCAKQCNLPFPRKINTKLAPNFPKSNMQTAQNFNFQRASNVKIYEQSMRHKDNQLGSFRRFWLRRLR